MPTTFDKLPLEIQAEIFKKLSYEDLKNACLVCPLWHELISTSQDFLERTKLCLNSFSSSFVGAEEATFTRNYKQVLIQLSNDNIDKSSAEMILTNITPACTQLLTAGIFFDLGVHVILHGHLLTEFLKNCSGTLMSFKISGMFENVETEMHRIKMTKLGVLSCADCLWICDVIECEKLAQLHCR